MIHDGDKGNKIADIAWESGELEQATACLACGETKLVSCYEGLEDLLGGLPGQWGFVACAGCGSLHLNPRPTPAAISKAYPDDYVTHDGAHLHPRDNGTSIAWRLCNGYLNTRFGTARQPASRLGRWLVPLAWPVRQQLDYYFRHLPAKPGRLLDVGCGNGAFLSRARLAGWVVQGIEPDPDAAAVARQNGIDVANCNIEAFMPEFSFDRITLSHVFEHLHAPGNALQQMRNWLRPDGMLWMTLPNPDGLGHRIFGRNWFALDPPRHIFLPSQHKVISMLKDAGYQDIRVMRRGRGARSSIMPSVSYARHRGGSPTFGGVALTLLIDILASMIPRFSEETVVIASRGSGA